MDLFFLFLILSILMLAVKQSHGALTSEAYWHLMLPDTPMPNAIQEHLSSVTSNARRRPTFNYDHYTKEEDLVKTARSGADGIIIGPEGNPVIVHRDTRRPVTLWYSPYAKQKELVEAPRTGLDSNYWIWYRTSKKKDPTHSDIARAVQPNADLNNKNIVGVNSYQQAVDGDLRIDTPSAISSFLERNLRVGAKVEAMFRRPMDGDRFLSPRAADSIPFSSSRLHDVLNHFSIDPSSFEAKKMGQVHYFCELPPASGEKKLCARTLESMVDFISASLKSSTSNTTIKALSSTAEKETAGTTTQIYAVESILAVPTQDSTAIPCHLEVYPYTVYHCHMTRGIEPYVINLVGQSAGDRVAAAAMCHRDTSDWDPDHPALRAHKVKPGEASMCHLLSIGDLAFVPSQTIANVANQ